MNSDAEDLTEELPGLVTGAEIQRELRKRRRAFLERTVPAAQEDCYIAEGWQIVRRNKRTIRIRKPKPQGQMLEDEVWTLLARMGFQQLSGGRQFRIPLSGMDPTVPPKQVDVLAIDGETAVVVECKASQNSRARSLQKDLNETRGLQDSIRQSIHDWFPDRPRVCFLYVTRNIRWSRNDVERAKAHHISTITDRQLDYYSRLVNIIGPASRHQLQADLLQDSPVQGLRGTVPALRGTFGGKTFYQFAIEPDRLLKLCYVSHRAKIDAAAVGTYQRLLRKKRLRDIAGHINQTGGIFPTNIVVNFRHSRRLRFDIAGPTSDEPTTLGTLHLPNTYKCAWVIDGQHRLYGFSLSEWGRRGRVPVLAFEGLDPLEEVKLFVDINSKQVRVPRSLLVELEPELTTEDSSPEVMLRSLQSQIALDLSENLDSPLFDLVATEWDTDGKTRPLTLPELATAISGSRLVGQVRGGVFYPGYLYQRDYDTTRSRASATIGKFIHLFGEGAPQQWEKARSAGGFLCTNRGVAALLRLFHAALQHNDSGAEGAGLGQLSADALVGSVNTLVEPVVGWFAGASDVDLNRFKGHYGSGAALAYGFELMAIAHEANSEFNPSGLEEHIRQHSDQALGYARELIAEIEDCIRMVTFSILKSQYGSDGNDWWRLGVPQGVRGNAAQKAEVSEEGGEPHQFLELLDYKRIAELPRNWRSFESSWTFDRSARSKSKRLAWMDRLNMIRNRVFHSGRRSVTSEEISFLEDVWQHVETKRKDAVKQ
ncbi:MAG: DGQHR domain-containing protein [Chloroflexi bacterium]|nr:DGQHR domain-containing protein [Chloroflexota bacterium]